MKLEYYSSLATCVDFAFHFHSSIQKSEPEAMTTYRGKSSHMMLSFIWCMPLPYFCRIWKFQGTGSVDT